MCHELEAIGQQILEHGPQIRGLLPAGHAADTVRHLCLDVVGGHRPGSRSRQRPIAVVRGDPQRSVAAANGNQESVKRLLAATEGALKNNPQDAGVWWFAAGRISWTALRRFSVSNVRSRPTVSPSLP
jgi:hypothetical protein